MLNAIKVGPQVKIDDAGLLSHDRLCHAVYRCMCCPFWTVAIRSRLEISLKDRLQDELQRSLNHTVANSRNRKHADFIAPVLRYLLLPRRHGPIRNVDQFIPYLLKKTMHSAFLDDRKRHSVNTRSAVI